MNHQVTHHFEANAAAGRVVVACGKVVKGHSSYRMDLGKVTCPRCLRVRRHQDIVPAPVAMAPAVPQNPRTKADWAAYVAAKGLKLLGQGVSRRAYALDNNRVLKIEYGAGAFGQQCAAEVRCFQQASENVKPFLAAILDYGDGWTIMERAQCTLREFGGQTDKISHDLSRQTRIGDLHAANIGYFGKGQFKILDYAL